MTILRPHDRHQPALSPAPSERVKRAVTRVMVIHKRDARHQSSDNEKSADAKKVLEVMWRLDVPFPSQPVRLRREISPDDVRLFVLNAPGPNDNDVAHAEPYSSFHLTWNSPHAGFSILRANGDSASAEHFFHRSKDFILMFSGQSHLAWLFFNQLNTSFDVSFSWSLL